MRITIASLVALVIALLAGSARAEITKNTVEYDLPDGTTAHGVAIYDDQIEGKRPGVLVIPEWWGLTEYPQERAEQLAEMGYVAFVADMYGEGKTTENPEEAQRLSGKAQQAGLAELAQPALDQLADMEQVDGEKLAAIGFCFGGGTVIKMAGSDYASRLKAVVSFHGTVSEDLAPEGNYTGPPMMILHGGEDPMVKPEALSGFVQKCVENDVPISVTSFPGAVHAFTNPDADSKGLDGVAYDESAAKLSWRVMRDFLGVVLDHDPDRDEVREDD